MYCRHAYWSEPTIVGICAYINRIMMIHNRNEWGGSTVLIKSSPLKNRFPTRHFRIYGLGPWPWRNFQQQRASTVKRVVEISSNVSQQKSRVCACSCKTICVQRQIFRKIFPPRQRAPPRSNDRHCNVGNLPFLRTGSEQNLSLFCTSLLSYFISLQKRAIMKTSSVDLSVIKVSR